MHIGLIDVDSHKFPNLALMKISAHHKQLGDHVEWALPMQHYDIVYQSKVFDGTYSKDIDWWPDADVVIKGGTGYGLDNKLPEEIEHIMPDYDLYGIKDTAYGFLTRGCPRACRFCIVAQKEGRCSHKVANLSEWWNGQKNIVLMDPNILACKDRMELLDQLIDSKAYVDFNQGLDIRLTNEEIADKLGQIKVKTLHFAWDNPKEDLAPYFRRFGEWYRRKSHSRKRVYVLTNYGSTMEENLHRIYTLRDLGYDPDVRIYDKPNAPMEIRRLQRWVNNKFIFGSCEKFEDYGSGGNTMTKDALNKILEAHKKWLNDEEGGVRANLSDANLSDANLSGANLSCANLSGANLRGANLRGANLSGANLSDADLSCANLSGANLSGANLSCANLSDADLSRVNLRCANLSDADLSGVNLRCANLSGANGLLFAINYVEAHFERTADGYIAYKTFDSQYAAPNKWQIEPGAVIEENVNMCRTDVCGCGINVAPLEWVKANYNGDIWKVLIRWEWLCGVCVPYNTDGKIRCERVELVEVVGKEGQE